MRDKSGYLLASYEAIAVTQIRVGISTTVVAVELEKTWTYYKYVGEVETLSLVCRLPRPTEGEEILKNHSWIALLSLKKNFFFAVAAEHSVIHLVRWGRLGEKWGLSPWDKVPMRCQSGAWTRDIQLDVRAYQGLLNPWQWSRSYRNRAKTEKTVQDPQLRKTEMKRKCLRREGCKWMTSGKTKIR